MFWLPASVFSVACTATIGAWSIRGYASAPRTSVDRCADCDERPGCVDHLEDLGDVLLRNQPGNVAREGVRRNPLQQLAAGTRPVRPRCLSPRMPLIFAASRPLPVRMTSRA